MFLTKSVLADSWLYDYMGALDGKTMYMGLLSAMLIACGWI
jgi:hypothetical protein